MSVVELLRDAFYVVQESGLPDLGQLVVLILNVVVDWEGDNQCSGIVVVGGAIGKG